MEGQGTEGLLEKIRAQVRQGLVRITQHAHQEMAEEDITWEEVEQAIASAQLLENYPRHRRGACCLICGYTADGRPLHVVCTTSRPMLIIITVYEPRPPKWVTPVQRGRKR